MYFRDKYNSDMHLKYNKSFKLLLGIAGMLSLSFGVIACTPLEDTCPNDETIMQENMNQVFVRFFSVGQNRFFGVNEMGYTSVENLENDQTRFKADGFFGASDEFTIGLPLNLNFDASTYVFNRANGLNAKDTVRMLNYNPRAEFIVENCQYFAETDPIPEIETNFNYFIYDSFDDSTNVSLITFYF